MGCDIIKKHQMVFAFSLFVFSCGLSPSYNDNYKANIKASMLEQTGFSSIENFDINDLFFLEENKNIKSSGITCKVRGDEYVIDGWALIKNIHADSQNVKVILVSDSDTLFLETKTLIRNDVHDHLTKEKEYKDLRLMNTGYEAILNKDQLIKYGGTFFELGIQIVNKKYKEIKGFRKQLYLQKTIPFSDTLVSSNAIEVNLNTSYLKEKVYINGEFVYSNDTVGLYKNNNTVNVVLKSLTHTYLFNTLTKTSVLDGEDEGQVKQMFFMKLEKEKVARGAYELWIEVKDEQNSFLTAKKTMEYIVI